MTIIDEVLDKKYAKLWYPIYSNTGDVLCYRIRKLQFGENDFFIAYGGVFGKPNVALVERGKFLEFGPRVISLSQEILELKPHYRFQYINPMSANPVQWITDYGSKAAKYAWERGD